jgi:imidazolonepropionase-like amidohydrolase
MAMRSRSLDKERGTIAPGMAADIIATPGDPLADPRVLKQVHFVMKDGRVVKGNPVPPRTAAK